MAIDKRLSKTMRIDLIPDAPSQAALGRRKRVVITTSKGNKPREGSHAAELAEDSLYRGLLQSIYDAVVITNAAGDIVDINHRAVDFFLYDGPQLLGLKLFDLISGADDSLVETLWKNLENERFTLIQAYCLRRNGTFFPAEIAVNKLRLGEMHLCFFVRDITMRRQAEEMLRTEHNAIQNAGNGIAVADMDSCLEYVNPAVGVMWGVEDTDQLIGHDVRVLFASDDVIERMLDDVVNNQMTWSGELIARRGDGEDFVVQVAAACNRNSDGEPAGTVFSFVDMRDRIRAQEAERKAERQRVMLESLGAACHHLGQPATVLVANLNLMQKKLMNTDSATEELVEGSIEAAQRLGEILHKLNQVNEYKTTEYLERRGEGEDGGPASRILDI